MARESPTGTVSKRPGFTLIELLMVVMVIGIITAMTLPSFVRSIRGNRLRMAARTVIMASRYARNMAILNQREMLVELNPESSRVAVRPAGLKKAGLTNEMTSPAAGIEDVPPWVEDKEEFARSGDDEEDGEDPEVSPPAAGAAEIVRTLDRVRIASVELRTESPEEETGDGFAEGPIRILYKSNGQCTPYEVTLEDDEGQTLVVKVDRLGSIETERF